MNLDTLGDVGMVANDQIGPALLQQAPPQQAVGPRHQDSHGSPTSAS